MRDHAAGLSSQESVCPPSSWRQWQFAAGGRPPSWGQSVEGRLWRPWVNGLGSAVMGSLGCGARGEGAEDPVTPGLGGRWGAGAQRGAYLFPAWAPPALCATLGDPSECSFLFPVSLTRKTRTTTGPPIRPARYTKALPGGDSEHQPQCPAMPSKDTGSRRR